MMIRGTESRRTIPRLLDRCRYRGRARTSIRMHFHFNPRKRKHLVFISWYEGALIVFNFRDALTEWAQHAESSIDKLGFLFNLWQIKDQNFGTQIGRAHV